MDSPNTHSRRARSPAQVGPREYNLVLNCDVNTRGHTQWFLYRIRGMEPGVPYRFNLINLMKPDSLFSSGMRPLVYSERTAATKQLGWFRTGEDIAYYMNQYAYAATPKKVVAKKGSSGTANGSGSAAAAAKAAEPPPLNSFYTLTFTISFPLAGDTCYVSQCYPYTYTMAQSFCARLVAERRSAMIRRETLCHSYGGNAVDLLSVTDFSAPAAEVAARRVVVISARVHPGESNASWMMAGLLEAVTADTPAAQQLRSSIMLKIIPMLNPDGVILGNYRCSVVGVDLNRQWLEPTEQSHPTIYALKKLMRGIVASEQLLLFCDLHGHSRKRNIFAYAHTHTCTHARRHTHMHTSARTFAHICTHICTHIYAHTHMHTHICTHTHMHTHAQVRLRDAQGSVTPTRADLPSPPCRHVPPLLLLVVLVQGPTIQGDHGPSRGVAPILGSKLVHPRGFLLRRRLWTGRRAALQHMQPQRDGRRLRARAARVYRPRPEARLGDHG